jgi:transposase
VDDQASQPPQRFSEEAFIGFVHRQLAAAESVHSCYEAGPFGYVLHRRLTALGVHNLVVRPRDWSTYGERVKTDARDAGALCSSLDRYLAGNRGALSVVWVPSEAESGSRSAARASPACEASSCRRSGGVSAPLRASTFRPTCGST